MPIPVGLSGETLFLFYLLLLEDWPDLMLSDYDSETLDSSSESSYRLMSMCSFFEAYIFLMRDDASNFCCKKWTVKNPNT